MKQQDFARFRDTSLIIPQRARLIIPAFTLAASAWGGASILLAEYPLANTQWFSIKTPIRVFGKYFVPAIRYYDADNDVVYRYKFWEDVNSVLFFPVYNGERMGLSSIIEIWSVNSLNAPTLSAQKILQSSVFVFPADSCGDCCTLPSSEQILAATAPTIDLAYSYCQPFCDGLYTP